MRRAPVLALTSLCVACGGAAGQGEGDNGSYAAPPRPPLKADPKAEPAVLAVGTGLEVLTLDPQARIRRILPLSEMTSICPGGRVLADSADSNAKVEVYTLGGKRRWAKRIPRGSIYQVQCLDPKGDQVLVVWSRTFPDDDEPSTVHLVSRRHDRTLSPQVYWAGLVTPTHLWEPNRQGRLVLRELPSLNVVRTYENVPFANWMHVSDDGRWAAITTLELEPPTTITLLDLQTGATRLVTQQEFAQVAGWLAPDSLVIHNRDRVQILGPDLQVREQLDDVDADGVHVIDGALIATDGARVYTLRGPSPFKGGKLPESVSLLGTVGQASTSRSLPANASG